MRADECGHDPEDHDEIESITGAVLCWDSPTGEFYCTACGGDPIDELPTHPCATIHALDGYLINRANPHQTRADHIERGES